MCWTLAPKSKIRRSTGETAAGFYGGFIGWFLVLVAAVIQTFAR